MPLKLGSNIDLGKVVKNLGQKYKLVPHLDLAIGEGEFTWDAHFEAKQGDDAWHPSGDCVPSLRELYLKASGQLPPETISPTLRKIFVIGHFYHQYLQWIVEHKLGFADAAAIERKGKRVWATKLYAPPNILQPGKTLAMEVPLSYHWATGAGDIAPCSIPGYGDYAVDFKTMNPRMFATGPSPDYQAKWECQGNIYLDFFDMEQILFVGIDKSNGDMKEWVFSRNQALIDAIYLKWKIVSECLDEGIEPPADEHVELPLQGPSG